MADAEGLLEAGVDAFAHGVRDRDIDDGFLALIATRGDLFLVPNLPDRGVATDLGWLAGTIPADELAGLQAQVVDRPDAQDTVGIQARTLAQLVRLPFNELKVDRRFVAEIGRHRQSELVIESTVAMAHRLGMEVCAEGIETPEALRFVHDAGCDSIQGFLVSEPLPADRVAGFLAGWVGLPI
jgi:hypothetical protein